MLIVYFEINRFRIPVSPGDIFAVILRLIKEDFIVCKNCGQVHDQYFSSEYIDFYEN